MRGIAGKGALFETLSRYPAMGVQQVSRAPFSNFSLLCRAERSDVNRTGVLEAAEQ